MLDARVVGQVDALEPIALTTEAFRHVAAGRHPLSGSGARLHGGRWNPPDSFATLYLAIERPTAIAEFHRLAVRQRRDPGDFLPRRLYRYQVTLAAVLDLRTSESRAAVGLTDTELLSDDPAGCQQVGEAAHYLSLEGIIAASATGRGTVLAVFVERLRADSQVRDLDYDPWATPGAIS